MAVAAYTYDKLPPAEQQALPNEGHIVAALEWAGRRMTAAPDAGPVVGGRGRQVFVADEIAEDFTVGDEGQWLLALSCGGCHQWLFQAVDDVDGVSLLVGAFVVAGPAGDDRRGALDFAALFEVDADDREQPFGDPVRAFGAEPGQGVPDVFVGEPLDQGPFVGFEVDSGDRLERGGGFLVHVVEQELREQWVLCDLVGVAVAGEVAEIAHALMASVHAVPMRVQGRTIGAMGLFGEHTGALTQEDVAIGQALADVATISILHERSIGESARVNEHLQRALTSRVLIEQAKGVIAYTAGVDMDEAFRRLSTFARANNQNLHDTAAHVIDRTLTL
jgi:GAF domain-containing protein